MAEDTEIPVTSPLEIEQSIRQERESNLDPRTKDRIERLPRTFLQMVGPM